MHAWGSQSRIGIGIRFGNEYKVSMICLHSQRGEPINLHCSPKYSIMSQMSAVGRIVSFGGYPHMHGVCCIRLVGSIPHVSIAPYIMCGCWNPCTESWSGRYILGFNRVTFFVLGQLL